MRFEDARRVPDGSVLRADVCVAGGGAAGITIARELSNTTRSVVVLESGGDELDDAVQDLYGGTATGIDYDVQGSRLRMFGGTTNHWAGWCRPLDPQDLEPRPWMHNSGWPFGKATLDPFYVRAREVCGVLDVGGDPFDPEPLVRAGAVVPLVENEVVATSLFRIVGQIRFGERYRGELERAANVRVVLHANVVGIATRGDGAHVTGFEVATLAGSRFRVEATTFVVALGGIENARLLLAAGVGNEGDLVGRYFMDHPEPTVGVLLTTAPLPDNFAGGRSDLVRTAATFTASALRREELPNAAFVVDPWPAFDQLDRPSRVDPDDVASVLAAVAGGAHGPHALRLRVEPEPNPESRVTLGPARDALGMPRVELRWQLAPDETDRHRRLVDLFVRELGRHGAGWVRVERADFARDPEGFFYGFHHLGTTRMHRDPARGVVDEHCRVHGVDNCYIAGSSVFPTAGYANPTLTIVALALRLADHILTLA